MGISVPARTRDRQRRSILVSAAGSEKGPKNPLKGITMKPVVPALNAQFGVGAGGSGFCRCGLRALSNGMEMSDPVVVETCFCIGTHSHCGTVSVRGRMGTCNAVPILDAVCRVACLAWRMRIGDLAFLESWPDSEGNCPLKYPLQKRITNR